MALGRSFDTHFWRCWRRMFSWRRERSVSACSGYGGRLPSAGQTFLPGNQYTRERVSERHDQGMNELEKLAWLIAEEFVIAFRGLDVLLLAEEESLEEVVETRLSRTARA